LVYAGRLGMDGVALNNWAEFCQLADEVVVETFEKGTGPGVMTAFTPNGRRRGEDFVDGSVVTGLVIDVDEDLPSMAPVMELCAALRARGITYHLQWRWAEYTYKTHLVLPYAEPYPVKDTQAVRSYQSELTQRLLPEGVTFDPATTKVAGLCYFMSRRPGSPSVPETDSYIGPNALDLIGMYPPWLQGEVRRKRARSEATAETHVLLGAMESHGWIESKGAWDIVCPCNHGDDYRSKTYLYPQGVISCMAGKCQGKPLAWFLSHLPDDVRDQVLELSTTPLKVELAKVVTKVTLSSAHESMQEALRDNRAIEGHATAVQVSTGAGKTRAVAEYLNEYSAPFEGEKSGSGLSAVLAVPTNALLREVDDRLNIPHIIKTGVLAVLNDDGTPACKKYDIAKPLQASGGNIHRLLCAHCEFKEDCPARENATSGEGSLTLTNHALMTSVADSLHDRGRHPLLVWDESPQWVETGSVSVRDLDWLMEEFDREAVPMRSVDSWIDAMVEVRLFNDRYRAAVRPTLEALRWIRSNWSGVLGCADVVREWGRLPSHQVTLARARDVTATEPSGDVWTDLTQTFEAAVMLNRSEIGYDTMREDTRKRVLRAENLMKVVGLMAGPEAVLVLDTHHISVSSLTPSGRLFRKFGGVVLDATANLTELRRLRPDLRAVSLRVQDSGDTERYIQHLPGLDRKSLKHRPERLVDCVQHAKRGIARWSKAGGVEPKVAVFTYQAYAKTVKELWPEADVGYFGNTRGYDRYFQEGFNTFVTMGDPITNLSALALQWRVLTGAVPDGNDPEWQKYVSASAESELAQAHGRARNPQPLKGQGGRLHFHYGRKVPAGWDSETCRVDPVSLNEDLSKAVPEPTVSGLKETP
jgi:hypothetical protein